MAEEFDVDVSPRELVAWIRTDQAQRQPALWASATRATEKAELALESARLSLEDEVAEVVTFGVLEVRPRHAPGGWALRMSVEEEAGEHPIGDEDSEEASEELSLDAFESEFLQSAHLIADITVTVDGDDGKVHFERWLKSMPSSGARRPTQE